jgi:hypothetical protein
VKCGRTAQLHDDICSPCWDRLCGTKKLHYNMKLKFPFPLPSVESKG